MNTSFMVMCVFLHKVYRRVRHNSGTRHTSIANYSRRHRSIVYTYDEEIRQCLWSSLSERLFVARHRRLQRQRKACSSCLLSSRILFTRWVISQSYGITEVCGRLRDRIDAQCTFQFRNIQHSWSTGETLLQGLRALTDATSRMASYHHPCFTICSSICSADCVVVACKNTSPSCYSDAVPLKLCKACIEP
jgi:hypothetical protein